MDCDRRPPPSVIANLMGFDDHQPLQQPIQKRQRVLSENYLQKRASLYISRKRLPSQRCSSMMEVDDAHYNSKDMEKVSAVTSGDQGCTAECVDVKEPSGPEYPYSYKLLHSPRNVPIKARQQSDSVFTCGLQDLRNTSLLPDYVREIKLLKPYIFRDNVEAKVCWNVMKSQQMHKHIPLKPSKGRFSVYPSKQLMIYKGLENEKQCLLFPSEKETTSSAKSFLHNRKHADSVSSVKGNWIKTHRSLIRPRACCGTNWHLIAEEANKSSPSESGLRVSERSSPSVPCISGLVCTNINSAFSTVLHNESVKDRRSTESQIFWSDRNNVLDESNGVCELSHVSSQCLDSGRMKDCHMNFFDQPAAVDNSIKSLARATQTEDSSGGTQVERIHWSPDDISQEASDSLSEDSLATCETSEPLSPTSSEEASRRSPNSVLESVTKGRVPSNMNCYKNDSSDLGEGYVEGPGMTVSSDEDNRDESLDTVQDTAEPSDLSYLVSMLDEACGRSDVILHSLENPIDPHVFDILEKLWEACILAKIRKKASV
uniref:DUF4378 domain-containing protein n=1 Tax=Kalanchoe fedtschenkoi TaxID=63787 RepID=A0A7N0UF29_KALFE